MMLAKLFSFMTNSENKPLVKLDNHFLYYYSSCPFCMRVLFTLQTLGLEIGKRNIHQDPQHLTDLIQGGGIRMVPCLRIEKDGQTQWMYESADIVAYLKNLEIDSVR